MTNPTVTQNASAQSVVHNELTSNFVAPLAHAVGLLPEADQSIAIVRRLAQREARLRQEKGWHPLLDSIRDTLGDILRDAGGLRYPYINDDLGELDADLLDELSMLVREESARASITTTDTEVRIIPRDIQPWRTAYRILDRLRREGFCVHTISSDTPLVRVTFVN